MRSPGALAACLALAGCASPAPCDGKPAMCLNVTVRGPSGPFDRLAVRATLPSGQALLGQSAGDLSPAAIDLPVQFALLLPADVAGEVAVAVTGELAGAALASGSARATLPPSGQTVDVELTAGTPDAAADASEGGDAAADGGAPPKTLRFAPAMNYPAGSAPWTVVIADYDRDGWNDVLIPSYGDSTVSLLRGKAGGLAPLVSLPVAGGPDAIALGDLDHDGVGDLALADYDSGQASTLRGLGGGSFGAPASFPSVVHGQAIALGDFNQDQQLDLAVGAGDSGDISILIGDGAGGFKPQQVLAEGGAGASAYSIVVADFDHDGHQDLAVANFLEIAILLGTGTGTFAAPRLFPAGLSPIALALADQNGDQKLDLVVANNAGNNVSVLLWQDDTALFGPSLDTPAGSAGTAPVDIAVGDFNGDQIPDAAVVNKNNVKVLIGQGASGALALALTLTADVSPSSIAAGDLNHDQRDDIAAASITTGKVSVLINTTQ